MLLIPRSNVINCLRSKYSAFIDYAQCMSWRHDTVSMCIMGLVEMISFQVIASNTVSGGLGFICSLA
jgi:hypothetical protein